MPEIEKIDSSDKLYLRVSCQLFKKQRLSPSVIRQQGQDGISVDWSRYSTATECRDRGHNEGDGVVSFEVGCIESKKVNILGMPEKLEVVHAPVDGNKAHALIVRLPEKGKADIRAIRNLLFECLQLEIPWTGMVS